MAKTIGSFEDFKQLIPEELSDSYKDRQNALQRYLELGGITKVEETKAFPKLVYPSKKRLEKQIEETKEKIEDINQQIKEWSRRHRHLMTNKITDTFQRIAEPLYWEHQAKLLTDPSYRNTYDLVKPPIHLINRKEWKNRLKMFIKSKEYRLRLHEARTSIIGKKREGMTKEVESRFDFNKRLARQERDKLLKKKKELRERLNAMHILLVWANENSR